MSLVKQKICKVGDIATILGSVQKDEANVLARLKPFYGFFVGGGCGVVHVRI